jgi:tRNA(Ile)-lysidine synthase
MSFRSATGRRLAREIESAGRRQGWWASSGIVVAVSGGGDSMALLVLLAKSYGGRVVAAHLEHGLRGAASIEDARFVEDFCLMSGIECRIRRVSVPSSRAKGESDETAGRRLRYGFFSEVASSEGLPFIATAHNAEDVVETVTHNFFRGSGVAGLSGIPARREAVVRPLIGIPRGELRAFLREEGVPWRDDETNNEDHYTRNKIRNRLLPWVRSNLNESAGRAVLGLADECAALSGELRAEAEVMLKLVSRAHPFALAEWDARAARRLSETQMSSVIRLQAEMLGLPVIDRKRIDALRSMIADGKRGRFQWALDAEVCVSGASIGWVRRGMLDAPAEMAATPCEGTPSILEWGPWRISVSVSRADDPDITAHRASRAMWRAEYQPKTVVISSADSFMRKNKSAFHVKIPWWSAPNTPVLSPEGANLLDAWTPGIRGGVRGRGVYVIIADVCVRKTRSIEGENF